MTFIINTYFKYLCFVYGLRIHTTFMYSVYIVTKYLTINHTFSFHSNSNLSCWVVVYSCFSSSHQVEHHHQVQPGPVCQQVRPARLVWDQRAGAYWRVSVYTSVMFTYSMFLFKWCDVRSQINFRVFELILKKDNSFNIHVLYKLS